MNTIQSFWATVLSVQLVSVVLAALTIMCVVLLILTVVVMKLGARIRYLATPIFDKMVKEAQEKSEHILVEAREQASALRVSAQTEADKIFSTRKEEDEHFRLEQTKHLEEITTYTKGLLEAQGAVISKLTEHMAEQLKIQVDRAEKAVTDGSGALLAVYREEDTRLKGFFNTIETSMQKEYLGLVEQTKRRVSDELTKEIEAVREAVAVYRQQRLAVIDAEIVGMVEDTARIALNKSLSLADHRDIVLAALAEAKQQGIFGSST